MKTIKELNEKILWRLTKFLYFTISWLWLIILFVLIYDLSSLYTEETKEKMKQQIEYLYSRYNKKKEWEIYLEYCNKFKEKYDYYYPLKYSYFNSIKNSNSDSKLLEIRIDWMSCFWEFGKWNLEEIKNIEWKTIKINYTIMFIDIFIVIILYILITFIFSRSIYYIVLWSFNPSKN